LPEAPPVRTFTSITCPETDARLERIADIFNEVNRDYFEGAIPTPKFVINNRLTRIFGRASSRRWSMEISPSYHDYHGWDYELVGSVKHETVHLYLYHMGRPWGHTKEFREICARIGGSQYAKPTPRRRPRYRYLMQCPQCEDRHYRGTLGTNLACADCCNYYNAGNFSDKFRLTLISREILD
jgi:predicted SprT family Zn-dependent metalloprotease